MRRTELRRFLERTLEGSGDELVSSGLAVLHAVKCAIVPKPRKEDERQHQNPPDVVARRCAPSHFSAEFWELKAPVVITLGKAARLAVRIACDADAGIPTQAPKDVAKIRRP